MRFLRWKNNKVPTAIIRSLDQLRGIAEDAKPFFKGWGFDQLATTLSSYVELPSGIPDHDKASLVFSALFAAAKNPLVAKNVIAEIGKASQVHFSASSRNYFLVTSISIKLPKSHLVRKVGDCTVRFSSSLPHYISNDGFLEIARQSLDAPLPSSYSYAIISTEGKSLAEAGSKALDAVDFIRGVWNFPIIPSFRISSGKRKPINAILLGPVQLLYHSDGSLVNDLFWFDPTYVTAIDPKDLKANWMKIIRFEKDVQNRLSHPFLDQFLQEAFRRYARALDERDYDIAFYRLWSLLEFLTQSTRDSYDVTIRRVAFLYSDRDVASEIMNHLRDMRNKHIHTGRSNPQGEMLVYQVKKSVEDMLLFYMRAARWFSTLEEARDFLDLPPDTAILRKRGKLIRLGIRFMKPRPIASELEKQK